MKKSKKKIKVRDMKPKKNPKAGGSQQGQHKYVQGIGRQNLN
jgi:hypothetical protein